MMRFQIALVIAIIALFGALSVVSVRAEPAGDDALGRDRATGLQIEDVCAEVTDLCSDGGHFCRTHPELCRAIAAFCRANPELCRSVIQLCRDYPQQCRELLRFCHEYPARCRALVTACAEYPERCRHLVYCAMHPDRCHDRETDRVAHAPDRPSDVRRSAVAAW